MKPNDEQLTKLADKSYEKFLQEVDRRAIELAFQKNGERVSRYVEQYAELLSQKILKDFPL